MSRLLLFLTAFVKGEGASQLDLLGLAFTRPIDCLDGEFANILRNKHFQREELVSLVIN